MKWGGERGRAPVRLELVPLRGSTGPDARNTSGAEQVRFCARTSRRIVAFRSVKERSFAERKATFIDAQRINEGSQRQEIVYTALRCTTNPGIAVRIEYSVRPAVMYSVFKSSPPNVTLVSTSSGTGMRPASFPPLDLSGAVMT